MVKGDEKDQLKIEKSQEPAPDHYGCPSLDRGVRVWLLGRHRESEVKVHHRGDPAHIARRNLGRRNAARSSPPGKGTLDRSDARGARRMPGRWGGRISPRDA